MNKKKLNTFITDIEKMHEKVSDAEIKSELCKEFERIKEKHFPRKETTRQNVYEKVEKLMYNSRGETTEVVPIDIENFKSKCEDNVRVERIRLVNQKLKNMEGEPLMISCLKGYLFLKHKNSIGAKNFHQFCSNTSENHDYSLFLIRLHKLLQKYKKLQSCRLPVRFFRSKFTIIKEICCNNLTDWE